LVLLVVVLSSLWTVASQAQEAVLEQLYGKGVHSYFSGDYSKAYERLTSVINAGISDPRAFYFRGLAYMQLGRTPEAEMDFRKGAELESKDINKYYNVGRALERIQGPERKLLESYRVQARMAAYAESEKLRKARYEALRREEARVLQQQIAEGVKAETAEPIPTPAAETPTAEPAGETPAAPADGSMDAKKNDAKKDTDATMKVEAEPAAEDPFNTNAAKPEKPAAEKKPAADEDPFAPGPAAAEKKTSETKSTPKNSIFKALGKSLTKGVTGATGKPGAAELPAPPTVTP
jgi:tetratricopeptide (TPR) repeat protein